MYLYNNLVSTSKNYVTDYIATGLLTADSGLGLDAQIELSVQSIRELRNAKAKEVFGVSPSERKNARGDKLKGFVI